MSDSKGAYREGEKISYQRVADELVVLDLQTGKYFGLNRTATYIFIALVEGTGDAAGYAARFKVTLAEAERDFAAIGANLVKRRFLLRT